MEEKKPTTLWNFGPEKLEKLVLAGLSKGSLKHDDRGLKYKDRKIIVRETPLIDTPEKDLIVSISGEKDSTMQEIINAFSMFAGYKPFCEYILRFRNTTGSISLQTYEWDIVHPETRYRELAEKQSREGSNISGLTRLTD